MGNGTGPRAGVPLEELDEDLSVFVEVIGSDMESGYLVIHDPDHLEPQNQHQEMPLSEALEIADEFCCDCFTKVLMDRESDRSNL